MNVRLPNIARSAGTRRRTNWPRSSARWTMPTSGTCDDARAMIVDDDDGATSSSGRSMGRTGSVPASTAAIAAVPGNDDCLPGGCVRST